MGAKVARGIWFCHRFFGRCLFGAANQTPQAMSKTSHARHGCKILDAATRHNRALRGSLAIAGLLSGLNRQHLKFSFVHDDNAEGPNRVALLMRESRIEPSLREIVAAASRRKLASLRPIVLPAERGTLKSAGGSPEERTSAARAPRRKAAAGGTATWGDIP